MFDQASVDRMPGEPVGRERLRRGSAPAGPGAAMGPYAAIGRRSDVGRCRRHNEDALHVNAAAGLLVIADGMGGHAAGDLASGIAVTTVAAHGAKADTPLAEGLQQAHQRIITTETERPAARGMGTTCVAARLREGRLEFAWLGDSRLYRLHAGGFEQLTRDHSAVQALVDAGTLRPAEVAYHPQRHVLARCLGNSGATPIAVETGDAEVGPRDRLLLCTDGLTGELVDGRIQALLEAQADDAAAAAALVAAALEAGGRDNISVIVATVA